MEEEDSDSDELAPKRPDRGDPDGGDSENSDSNCEKNDCRTIKTDLQDQSETRKHPTFNLPSPFKAIDLRNIYNFGLLSWSQKFPTAYVRDKIGMLATC